MLKEKDRVLRAALVFADALAVSLAFLLSFLLRDAVDIGSAVARFPINVKLVPNSGASATQYNFAFIVAVPLWCFMLYVGGVYRSVRTMPFFRVVWGLLKAVFLMFFGYGAALFVFKATYISRLFFFMFMATGFLLLTAEKAAVGLALHNLHRKGRNFRRLLVVGTGRRAAEFVRLVRGHPEWGLKVLGAVDDEPGRGVKAVDGVPVVGTVDDIQRILHSEAVDEVVFVVPRSRLSHVENALHDCETEGVEATFAVDLFDMKIARSAVSEIDGIPLLRFSTVKITEWELVIKRLIDLVGSGLALIVFGPLMVFLAVTIKLTSPGPVFFKQERLGLHGRRFKLLKFRTMRLGAHEVLSQVSDLAEMTTPEFRAKKLKYITPVGRFMRKFSLDELPQFLNVFAGRMSLVGPRPTVPDEVDKYRPWHRRRFSMKPGITCLWQVNGRNNVGFEEWMKLDLEYLDNWSLWLDFKILAKTVPVVIFGIGAY
jgi:exopolysaccharide biosynthesis polyprenyl glycosylphosphotransferase